MSKKISIEIENDCLVVTDKELDEGILTFNLDYADYDLVEMITKIILRFIEAPILAEIRAKQK